ncbi:MAG: putative peptide modification system cyclase, partial [Acidobacteriota bacterium]
MSDTEVPTSSTAERALFLCDLVRSTDLFQRLGEHRTAELLRRHDRLARDLLGRYDGLEIDKSDGFLFLFRRIADAVGYAVAYHAAVGKVAAASEVPFAARAGIHFGEVLLYENTPEDVRRGAKPLEVEGLAKPLAARLMSLALPGQTLLTRAAYELARAADLQSPGEELEWMAHGKYRVQGLIEPVSVFEVGVPALSPLSAPPGSSKIRRFDAGPAASKPALLVLPFEMIPAGDEHAFLSEGLADEIITDL